MNIDPKQSRNGDPAWTLPRISYRVGGKKYRPRGSPAAVCCWTDTGEHADTVFTPEWRPRARDHGQVDSVKRR